MKKLQPKDQVNPIGRTEHKVASKLTIFNLSRLCTIVPTKSDSDVIFCYPHAFLKNRRGLRVSFICIVVGQGNPTRGPE